MKILHVNNSDLIGGAALAAYRLHKAICKKNVLSQMKVRLKTSDSRDIVGTDDIFHKTFFLMQRLLARQLNRLFIPRKGFPLSFNLFRTGHGRSINNWDCDIVNFHWVNKEFISLAEIGRIAKPIVWTLHDMWPFTGGCHYSGECTRYEGECGICPQMRSKRLRDLSHWGIQRKLEHWRNLNLTVVAPSNWIGHRAQKSTLFKDVPVEIIPNGVDMDVFKKMPAKDAHEAFGLPQDKFILCYGAMDATSDKRKGYKLLLDCLKSLSRLIPIDDVEVVVFGASRSASDKIPEGYASHFMGTLHDPSSMALLLSACDIFISPSMQDNLPNTLIEAMACGTPCVAFNVGGIPDIVEHKKNGYLARPYDVDDLANGIVWLKTQKNTSRSFSISARESAENRFDINEVAEKYLSLYKCILSK